MRLPTLSGSQRALLLLSLVLLIFQAGRLFLLLNNAQDFASLGPSDVALAWLSGLRFDLSIAVALVGAPLLLLALPVPWARHAAWRWGWGLVALVVTIGCLVVLGAGAIYFGYVHRHIGGELLLFFNDGAIALASIGEFWLPVALALLVITGLVVVWGLVLRAPYASSTPRRAWITWVTLAVLAVLAIRGGPTRKPIGMINAFSSGSSAQGNLALNAVFVAARTGMKRHVVDVHLVPPATALDAVRGHVASSVETFPDPGFPLYRQRTPAKAVLPGTPNVIIVMLESWGLHVGALRTSYGLPSLDTTPEFDALCRQGVFFTRCYANGQRSMEGFAAILGGMITIPGSPYLGEGLEMTRLRYLGNVAAENGYDRFLMQGSLRSSYRVDAIAGLAGFPRYAGAEDIPAASNGLGQAGTPARLSPIGAHDGDLFEHAMTLSAESRSPFLGYVFSLSTHGPYSTPDPRWDREVGGTEANYCNSLRYCDWALGRFIRQIRASAWGHEALIVLVADHSWGQFQPMTTPVGLHAVPLLLLHPALLPRVDDRICSQVDLVPSLMDLLGWRGTYTGLGRSLWDARDDGRCALVAGGDFTSLIDAEGWVRHRGNQRIDAFGTDADARSKRLLALHQALVMGVVHDQVRPR